MKVGKQFLTLNPMTWEWHLSDRLEDLNIWDYHHDLECMPKPEIEGWEIRYFELTVEQLVQLEGGEHEPVPKAA
jgi:hypothetical protein